MICPECGASFEPKHHLTLFCTPAHKRAYYNLAMKRGGVLLPLVQVMRSDKSGKTDANAYARREAWALLDRWNREDKAAGRSAQIIVGRKMVAGWRGTDL